MNDPEVAVIDADVSLVRPEPAAPGPEHPVRLFPDAKVAENHVQDVLDIDPAGEAAKRAGSNAQLLGQQILAARHFSALSPPQGGQDLLKRPTVTLAGN
jgi:hypothetical protein